MYSKRDGSPEGLGEVTPINIGMCYYCKYVLAWKFTADPVRTGAPGIESVYLNFIEPVALTALYLKICFGLPKIHHNRASINSKYQIKLFNTLK